jgi:hypothetical protein
VQDTLLEPLFLFFVIGVIAGVVKSDIRLPDAVYQLLSTYLLLAIGLKGGVLLAESGIGAVLKPILGTIFLGVVIPLIGYAVARGLGKMDRANSAALAAHYGSASAVTFAVALAMLQRQGIPHEGYMPVLLVVLEIPAILVALALYRRGGASKGAGYAQAMHEIVVNRSVFLLFAGLLVGWMAGPERFQPYRLLFVDAFKPVLAFFILEMGLLAAQRLGELRSRAVFIASFAIALPVVAGFIGAAVAWFCGLSPGGAIILAATAASASYIAAPAAVRIAIPEANTGLCVAAALGVTFPFNLSLGLPLYRWMVERLYAALG